MTDKIFCAKLALNRRGRASTFCYEKSFLPLQRAAGGGIAVWQAERNGLLRASRTVSKRAGEDTPLRTMSI